MKRIFLVDVGNSTTVVCDYTKGNFSSTRSFSTKEFKQIYKRLDFDEADYIIVSSVVPETDLLLKDYPGVIFVTSNTIQGIQIAIDDPSQLGADRLVNALAAYQLKKGPVLVIDSGTAITFCYVDGQGVYQGGAILPGMGIASRALNDYTAKIPMILVEKQDKLLGKSTKEAVQVGLYQGYLVMIKGMIQSYRKRYSPLFVVGTGSGLDIFKDELDLDSFEPNLILKGLASFFKISFK